MVKNDKNDKTTKISVKSKPVMTKVRVDKANTYAKEIKELKATIPCWDNMFSSEVDPEDRAQAWVRLEVLGEPLVQKYAWAVPDEKALQICASFGPLIEIGSGLGYWAHLLQQRSVDIVAVDKYTHGSEEAWCTVIRGDAKILKTDIAKTKLDPKTNAKKDKKRTPRTLLLCYPDQGENMASSCLENFEGDTILHVGELLPSGTGTRSGGLQAPWGRTTGADFQVALAESFHCVLSYALPSMPFAKDYLTVWVRTKWTPGRWACDAGSESGASITSDPAPKKSQQGKPKRKPGEEEEDEECEDDCWADIPEDECLPAINIAAPKFAHLLS